MFAVILKFLPILANLVGIALPGSKAATIAGEVSTTLSQFLNPLLPTLVPVTSFGTAAEDLGAVATALANAGSEVPPNVLAAIQKAQSLLGVIAGFAPPTNAANDLADLTLLLNAVHADGFITLTAAELSVVNYVEGIPASIAVLTKEKQAVRLPFTVTVEGVVCADFLIPVDGNDLPPSYQGNISSASVAPPPAPAPVAAPVAAPVVTGSVNAAEVNESAVDEAAEPKDANDDD